MTMTHRSAPAQHNRQLRKVQNFPGRKQAQTPSTLPLTVPGPPRTTVLTPSTLALSRPAGLLAMGSSARLDPAAVTRSPMRPAACGQGRLAHPVTKDTGMPGSPPTVRSPGPHQSRAFWKATLGLPLSQPPSPLLTRLPCTRRMAGHGAGAPGGEYWSQHDRGHVQATQRVLRVRRHPVPGLSSAAPPGHSLSLTPGACPPRGLCSE